MSRLADKKTVATVRVAIYTRKSTDHGLDQAFTSLDAQRQLVENFIASRREQGWIALPEKYDDGGFTGANTDRPALQRLLADLKAGRIDVVAVYRHDRISRSVVDFGRLIELFDEHSVAFVSVTEQFDTSNSVGRLFMNMLMSFAEYEREAISERTRDKIAATRRKGLWTGGRPPLGYTTENKKLVVVEEEAVQVREMFDLYQRLGSMGEVVAELNRRGWTTATGKPWRKSGLRSLLTNPIFIGKITYRDEVYEGQHEAIISDETWAAVQAQRERHGRRGGSDTRNKWGVLLRDMLRCASCGQLMGHTYSKKGAVLYHYYVCPTHQVPSAERCEGARANARELEAFVIDRIRDVGKDPALIADVARAAQEESQRKRPELEAEQRRLRGEVRRLQDERGRLLDALAQANGAANAITERIADVDEQIRRLESRGREVQAELIALETNVIDADDLRAALAEFDGIWDQLLPREQIRVLQLLIEEIRFDGANDEVEISFRSGIDGIGRGDAA